MWNTGSVDCPPTASPTPSPTLAPTVSLAPTPASYTFTSRTELQTAVNLWVSDERSAKDTYGPIANWDTVLITDMEPLFPYKSAFNDDISSWSTASVTSMCDMFISASAFNQPIGSWNTSSVTNMYRMFRQAPAFNQDLSSWNINSVTTMRNMFMHAAAFNQYLCWDVSESVNTANMFKNSPGSLDCPPTAAPTTSAAPTAFAPTPRPTAAAFTLKYELEYAVGPMVC